MNPAGASLSSTSGRCRGVVVLFGAGALLGFGGTGLIERWICGGDVAGAALGAIAESMAPVAAAPAPAPPAWSGDLDGDGLYDNSERLLGTDPLQSDTDGDGCSDLYELAAFGDPLNATNLPSGSYFVRPFTYQLDQTTIRFSFFIFEPSGQVRNVFDRWGLVYRDRWEDASAFLPYVRFQRRMDQLGPQAPSGSAVFEVGYNTPRSLFQDADPNYLGWHLYFSANWGSSVVHGVFNLRLVRGQLVETIFASTSPGGGGGGQLGASFATFRPFDAGAAEAASWQRNRACVLYLSNAPYHQQETGLAWFPVRAASCEPMGYAFCAPGCTSTEWSVQNNQAVRLLDPFALAGL